MTVTVGYINVCTRRISTYRCSRNGYIIVELVKEMSELHLEQLVSQLLPELFRMYTDQVHLAL